MLRISEKDITNRLRLDNPWWKDTESVAEKLFPKRSYFSKFYSLVDTVNKFIFMCYSASK